MRTVVIGLALMLATGIVAAQHESSPPAVPTLVPQSLTGATSFDLYCASCHGRGGTGDGPVASAMRTRPADLTMLLRRHGGSFPRDEVRAYIDGTTRLPAAHGSTDMPVWGPTLRGLEGSDARARVRLDNLVAYIESIQQPAAQAPVTATVTAEGATLFQQYCANCHGRSGRGDGPMNGQLRRPAADLTKFSMRNGGVFPEARVSRIVDGRDVAAHGDREMPVWGDVFRRDAGVADSAAARARIAALVQFLASIQERPAE